MQTSRTFRIFVSSTFSDLEAERNALQKKVFPRLRDLAAAHGRRFQANLFRGENFGYPNKIVEKRW